MLKVPAFAGQTYFLRCKINVLRAKNKGKVHFSFPISTKKTTFALEIPHIRAKQNTMLSNLTLKILSFIFVFFAATATAFAQQEDEELPDTKGQEENVAVPLYLKAERAYYQGDSIPCITTQTIWKYGPMIFKNDKERDQYNRLVRNVKLLLPYAKQARTLVIETYEIIRILPDEKSKKKHIDAVEKELRQTYTPIFKKLTRSQGRLLVKLIDRECNMSGYNIAQAFIGAARANVYQGLGWIFGLNLNKKYDPEGDDRMTERVIRLVESHQI